jgi:tetratricopeptide (TPR) repeat protein
MSLRSGRLLSTLFLVGISLFVTFCNQPSAFAGEPQWMEIRSPHFSVVTDAGEKRGREVAMRFEQMRAVFGALMTKANINLPIPLQIVAFRNGKELRQFAPLFKGKPIELAGLFQQDSDRSFILLDMAVENPWTVVFHEYAHQLMNGNLQGEFDPWFQEGFAEYFSSIEVDNKEARVGKIPSDEYKVVQQVGMMKIADLFKVRQNSQTYNESGDHRTTFYAQSSLVMHYIYDNQLLPKVATYFDLEYNQHIRVEEAIQRAFGMSPTQFDKTLRDYFASGRYKYYPIPNPPGIASSNYSAAPLSAADGNAVLAEVHLHARDYQEQASNEFKGILKSDPNNAEACRGLGFAYLQKQDYSQASEYFKRAAQLDSKDPRVHYYIALLMARENGFAGGAHGPDMARELESSITLDPNFADSYALLAFTQSGAGDPAEALVTMRKALAISPRNEGYLYNLANLYLANRQPNQAIALLESLRGSDNPALASQVGAALAQAQQFKQMLQAGASGPPAGVVLVRKEDSAVNSKPAAPSGTSSSGTPAGVTNFGAAKFIRGTLGSVDCSTEPAATLTIRSGSQTLKMQIADRNHVVLIGADQFSCSWTSQKVAINYREGDTGIATVISLEIQ